MPQYYVDAGWVEPEYYDNGIDIWTEGYQNDFYVEADSSEQAKSLFLQSEYAEGFNYNFPSSEIKVYKVGSLHYNSLMQERRIKEMEYSFEQIIRWCVDSRVFGDEYKIAICIDDIEESARRALNREEPLKG